MNPQSTFPTLPSVVYRKIAEYLPLPILVKCDVNSYLTLHRNLAFASQIRSVMKKPLQLSQNIFATRDDAYVLGHYCVRHNPFFMESLTSLDLC